MGYHKDTMDLSHSGMVTAFAKPGEDILKTLTAGDANLMHMLLGITGEVGELVDAIKKSIIYGKPLDRENVIEEMGDIEFYMEGLRQGLDISRMQTLQANVRKLGLRYMKGTYSDEQAQARADKESGQ